MTAPTSNEAAADDPPPRDRLRWTLALALVLIVAAFAVGETQRPAGDLQLVAPLQVRPGDSIPLIAFHFGEGRGEWGNAPSVAVTLYQDDRTVAETTLPEAAITGYVGTLPSVEQPGTYRLVARAQGRDAEQPVQVERRVTVDASAPALEPRGRPQTDLQRFQPGPLEPLGTHSPPPERAVDDGNAAPMALSPEVPSEMDVRISGGACNPETPCEALIWVGHPAAQVGIEPTAQIGWLGGECGRALPSDQPPASGGSETTPAADPEAPATADGHANETPIEDVPASPSEPLAPTYALEGDTPSTTGVLRCRFVVHGNEGNATFVAFRDGHAVARRAVQLPLTFATPSVHLASRADTRGSNAPVLQTGAAEGEEPLLEAGRGALVDVFHQDRWVFSGSTDDELQLPERMAEVGHGLWRVQARHDAFGADHVASIVQVGGPTGARLDTAFALVRRRGWPERMAGRVPTCDGPPCTQKRLTDFVLAPFAMEILTYPPPTSGRPQELRSLDSKNQQRLSLAVLLVLLAGLLVAAAVVQRGKQAQRRAQALMASLEEEDGGVAVPTRPPGNAAIWGAGLFVLLMFASAAAIILSRGCIVGPS